MTSSSERGVVVPIPILPFEVILILSRLLVPKIISVF